MYRVLCFAILILQCSCNKVRNDLRIPSVADLNNSDGSIGNIGGGSIGNIANIAQSNIGALGGIGNIGSNVLPNIGSLGSVGNNGLGSLGSIGNLGGGGLGNLGQSIGNVGNIAQSNLGSTSIGNVATIVQTNVDTTGSDGSSSSGDSNSNDQNDNGSQGNVGNVANVAQSNAQGQGGIGNIATVIQSNVNTGQPNANSIGNVGNIAQSNVGAQQGSQGQNIIGGTVGNVGNIAQSNVNGLQGTVGTIGNIANIGQSNINALQGTTGSIGNIANIGQSNIGLLGPSGNIGNVANIGQNNLEAILNYLYSNGQNYYSYGRGYNNNNNYNNNINKNNNINNNNNVIGEDRNIERPCQVFDTYCIKKYFAENSRCKESLGPVPDPMYRSQSKLYLPRINLTVTARDVLYGGLNGRIEEFYINKETDKLVLSIEFRNLTVYSKDSYFRFHRRAREPIVNVDYLYVNYRSVVSTVIIPNRKDLQLHKSEIVSYVNDIPNLSIGKNAFEHPDPTVQLARIQLLNDYATNVQEVELTESAYYASTFIQYSLCDFGLKVL